MSIYYLEIYIFTSLDFVLVVFGFNF